MLWVCTESLGTMGQKFQPPASVRMTRFTRHCSVKNPLDYPDHDLNEYIHATTAENAQGCKQMIVNVILKKLTGGERRDLASGNSWFTLDHNVDPPWKNP